MKTVAIIQARAGSQRLPEKVLLDIAGKPMLDHVVDRIRSCKSIDQVVVATTIACSDDPLVQHCIDRNIDVVRGSEDDVLSRYVLAAERFSADNVVRITSDCPLIDAGIVDDVVDALVHGVDADYACNFFPQRLFPRGLDAEAFTIETLRRMDADTIEARHREHVTLWAYEHPMSFRIASVSNRVDHSRLRWTVDTQQDMDLVRRICQYFADLDVETYGYADIMKALSKNWHWCQINQNVKQKVA